jgi:predicted phosphodiesterase
MAFLDQMRRDNDGLRWVFSGHTHHQSFVQTRLVNSINPGAIENSFDGYSFAVVNTENGEVVFSRIHRTKPIIPTFSVGVISDSGRISNIDPDFWESLAQEFNKRGANTIIHCGNINLKDIGRPELRNFLVYCNLREDQKRPAVCPDNWRIICNSDNPVVEINGYRFYVQLDLGIDLLQKSEFDMHTTSLELRRKFPELDYILCGFTHNALLVEGEQIKIINPGDVIDDRNFAVICLPRNEITFGHIPAVCLPSIED